MAATLPIVMQISTKADGSAQKILALIDKDARKLETTSARVSRQMNELQKTLSSTGGGAEELQKVTDSAKRVGDELKRIQKEADDAVKSLKGFGDAPAIPPPGGAGAATVGGGPSLGNLVQSAAIGSAVTSAFSSSIQSATEFEAELRNLNTITEMSDEALKAYGANLRTLSLELKTSTGAAENARAAYDVASAGFVAAADNAAILGATLKAATAGNVDAATAAKLLSGSLKAFGEDASEAERFTNVFFATVKSGITTFPELAATLGNVTGVAANAGVSIEELGAAVATATSRGIQTSQAVDGLRGALANLLAPSDQAKEEMSRLGITVNETTLKQQGLLNTLREISTANGGSAESFKKILGDVQAFNVALSLTSDGGQLFSKNLNDISTNVTALSDAVEEKAKTLKASLDQFKVALEAASGSVGDTFLPAGKAIIDLATDIAKVFVGLPDPVRDFVTVMGTLAVATGASVKVVKLLATATQLETIQLALNTAAKTLNTTVTVANTRATLLNLGARAKNITSLAGTTLAANAASLSLTGMAATLKASAVATGFLGGAFAIVAGGVAGAAIAVAKYTELQKEQNAISKDLLDVELRMAKGQKEYAKLINKTTKELKAQGVATRDLTDAILANLERQEAAKKAGNQDLLDRLKKENIELRKVRKEIAEDEADTRNKRKTASDSASTSSPGQGDKEREKQRKELLANELSRIEILKNKKELSAQQEIKALGNVLAAYKVNGDERRRIEERIATLIGQQRVKSAKETQKGLEESLKSGTKIPTGILKNKKGTQEAVDAYSAAIKKVEEWQQKNKDLIKQFPELGQKAESALEKLRAEKAAAETARLDQNLKELQREFKQAGAKADTLAKKLDVVKDQVLKVKQAQRAGTIEQQAAEDELARLTQQRLHLEQSITNQKLKQAGDLIQLEITSVEQEIAFLEIKREQGLNVENELIAKRQERKDLELQALETEKKAALEAAGKDADARARVEEQFQAKRRNLDQQHTLDYLRENQKRLDGAANQSPTSAPAGPPPAPSSSGNSPATTSGSSQGPANSSGSGVDFNFSGISFTGIRGLSNEERKTRRQQSTISAEQRRLLFERANPGLLDRTRAIDAARARQIAAASANKALSNPFGSERVSSLLTQKINASERAQRGFPAEAASASPRQPSQTNNVTNTVTVNVEGRKTKNVDSPEAAVREVRKAITENQFYDPKAGL